MKTVIIVDDELFFRKSICSLIKKQENYEVIGEANNGLSGAEIVRELKPDMALVDISMPVMDGLEMIRSLVPDCQTKFILSTGYSDFAYAKQAISLGVKEYLLKPIDNRELLDCLDKLSREIDSEHRRQGVISDYYQTRSIYQKHMALNFFSKAVSGSCRPEEFAVLKKQAELENADWFTVLSLKPNSANTTVWNWETDLALCHSIMENICTEVFHETYKHLLYVDYSLSHQYIILGQKDSVCDISQLETLCEHLIKLLKDTVHIPVSIFSGTPQYGAQGIKASYEEALSVQHNSSYKNLTVFKCYSQEQLSPDIDITSDICRELLLLLRRKEKEQAIQYICTTFNKMQETNCHIRKIRLTAAIFISALDDFITECGCFHIEFTALQNALDSYRNCENIEQLKELLTDTYTSVLEQCSTSAVSGKTSLISEIQDYIALHYMDPELRLETISAHFFVSPQYLSTLFSQESHTTLSCYINTFRMHKAKEFLLQQSPSIQNTAALCGFTDPGYFSKCFKKFYGISPKNFLALRSS